MPHEGRLAADRNLKVCKRENGGNGFGWFDKRFQTSGVMYYLSPEARNLYRYYVSIEEFNRVEKTQRQVRDDMGMAFKTIGRCHKELIAMRMLDVDTSKSGSTVYLLPFAAAHYADVEERRRAVG